MPESHEALDRAADIEAFLYDLSQVYHLHGMYVASCSCCGGTCLSEHYRDWECSDADHTNGLSNRIESELEHLEKRGLDNW